jgi:phosphoribosylglycinamide formyltransferase 1
MQRKRVAILISGRGSNMASLIAAAREPDYPAEIVSVISNRPEAEGLRRAREAGIPALAVDHKAFPDRLAFEQALDQALREHEAELICLAGFMRVFTPWFIEQWPGRMLNIHPSLLPLFKGIHTHREALAAGVRIHGCTVHFVVPELDSGPIIAQAAVPVLSGDTEDALAARVLVQEHVIYPEALRLVCEGKAALLDRRAVFCGNDGTPSPAAALVSCGG